MGWESFGVVRFDLGPLLQGQTRIAKPKSAYNSYKNLSPEKDSHWLSIIYTESGFMYGSVYNDCLYVLGMDGK